MTCQYRTADAWTKECKFGKCAHQELDGYNPICGNLSASGPMIWRLREEETGESLINQIEKPNCQNLPVYVHDTEKIKLRCFWHLEHQRF